MPYGAVAPQGNQVGPVKDGAGFPIALDSIIVPQAVGFQDIFSQFVSKAIVTISVAVVFYVGDLLPLRFLQAQDRRAVMVDHGVVGRLSVGPVAVTCIGVVGFVPGRGKAHVGRHHHQSFGNELVGRIGRIIRRREGIHFPGLCRKRRGGGKGHLRIVRGADGKAHAARIGLGRDEQEHAAAKGRPFPVGIDLHPGRGLLPLRDALEIRIERPADLFRAQALEQDGRDFRVIRARNGEFNDAHQGAEVHVPGRRGARHDEGRWVVGAGRHPLRRRQGNHRMAVVVGRYHRSRVGKMIGTRRGQRHREFGPVRAHIRAPLLQWGRGYAIDRNSVPGRPEIGIGRALLLSQLRLRFHDAGRETDRFRLGFRLPGRLPRAGEKQEGKKE